MRNRARIGNKGEDLSKESKEMNRWARGSEIILMGVTGETGW